MGHWDRTIGYLSPIHSRLSVILGLNLMMISSQRTVKGAGGSSSSNNNQKRGRSPGTGNCHNMENSLISGNIAATRVKGVHTSSISSSSGMGQGAARSTSGG